MSLLVYASLLSATLHKIELANQITDLLRVPKVQFSTGSTEPRELFLQVAEALGIDISEASTKPAIAKKIVESAGEPWQVDYESSGSTITLKGLEAVHSAVEFFLQNRPAIN